MENHAADAYFLYVWEKIIVFVGFRKERKSNNSNVINVNILVFDV